jgi:chorismate mutase
VTAETSSSVVDGLRGQITAIDVELVELVNRRLRVVDELWSHKRENAQPLRSPEREEWLLQHLLEGNNGPLSEAGVRRLHELVLELARNELA